MTEVLTELKQEAATLETELEAKRAKMNSGKLKDFTANVTSLAKVTLKCRKVLVGHLSKVNAFDWDGDSENILSASQDGKLIIWNSHTGLKCAAVPLKSSWVMTCAYCRSDSEFLACGGLDNICTIYRKVGDENPRIKQELVGHEGYISSCEFLSSSQIISASGDATCRLWDIPNNKEILALNGHTSDIMKVCLKPGDKNIVVTGSCDKTCKVWDLRTACCIQSFATHEEDINCVTFHPSGDVVATASDDGTCRMYDLKADNEIAVFNYESNGAKVDCTACSFSLSGRLLFVGQEGNVVNITDTLKGFTVGRLTDHENRISCLSVSPNGYALCTGSWDSLLRIYA